MSRAASEIEVLFGSVITTIAGSIRGFLQAAPGHTLLGADLSNIEGRGLAYLAGEEWKLEAFRQYDKGMLPDIYVQSYSRSFHTPLEKVNSDQRQIGKVQELALGYQGGKGAYVSMARLYGIEMEEQRAEEIKIAWREAHPRTVAYWYAVEDAAIRAVQNPGAIFRAGAPGREVAFRVKGSFLFCQLPSKRLLSYPYPKIKEIETPWGAKKMGLVYMGEGSISRKWEEQKFYGGLGVENITQGFCRDILAEAMLRLEAAGFPIVLHSHDEAAAEVLAAKADKKKFVEIMTQVPEWAKGLPIAAKAFCGERYGKG